jgi:hypothetical protein
MSAQIPRPFVQASAPPPVLVILGVDGSGKNYVANVIEQLLTEAGYRVEKRAGGFSSPPTQAMTSEDKGRLALLIEQVFLWSFPLLKTWMPCIATVWIRRDLARFKGSHSPILVVSHSAVRLVAFYLGHVTDAVEDLKVPRSLDRVLRTIIPRTGAKVIVLDIDNQIRQQRVAQRLASGTADYLDRYMAKPEHRELSERIEACLVVLAKRYLDAVVIENNDLSQSELTHQIQNAFFPDSHR